MELKGGTMVHTGGAVQVVGVEVSGHLHPPILPWNGITDLMFVGSTASTFFCMLTLMQPEKPIRYGIFQSDV